MLMKCWYCHYNSQVCRFYRRVASPDVQRGVCPRAGIRLRGIIFWGWIFRHRRRRGRRYWADGDTRVMKHSVIRVTCKITETIIYAFKKRWRVNSSLNIQTDLERWLRRPMLSISVKRATAFIRQITDRTEWSSTKDTSLLFGEQRLLFKKKKVSNSVMESGRSGIKAILLFYCMTVVCVFLMS